MDPAAPTPPSTELEPLPPSIVPSTPVVETPLPPLATSSPSPNPLPALTGEEWLAAQTRKVFDGVAALAASELKATSDEFQLLEQINRVASAKYAELSDTVESLEEVSKELIEQHTSLASHLDEIDAVDKSVQSLEETIAALDKYTKQLEIAAIKAVADAAQ